MYKLLGVVGTEKGLTGNSVDYVLRPQFATADHRDLVECRLDCIQADGNIVVREHIPNVVQLASVILLRTLPDRCESRPVLYCISLRQC